MNWTEDSKETTMSAHSTPEGVWCIAGDAGGKGRVLAELLLQDGHSVAVIEHQIAPFAMLVNRYGDAMLAIEARGDGGPILADAAAAIGENFGEPDTIAIVLGDLDDSELERARAHFATTWPDAEILSVA